MPFLTLVCGKFTWLHMSVSMKRVVGDAGATFMNEGGMERVSNQ